MSSRPHRIKKFIFLFVEILWGPDLKAVQIGSFDQVKMTLHIILLISTVMCFIAQEHRAFAILFEDHPCIAMIASGILITWLYYSVHRDLH